MFATAECMRPQGALGPVEVVWHVPADPEARDSDCDAQSIAHRLPRRPAA